MMMFVYVCLEVVDFFIMFVCWDSVEPIWYYVCDVYAGCGGWLVAGDSFASWSAISLLAIKICALIFSIYCYVKFGPQNLVDYGKDK